MAEFRMPKELNIKPWHVILIALAVVIIWGAGTSIVQVEASDVGLVLRFGEYVDDLQPGLNFILPFGIEEVVPVGVKQPRSLEFGYRTVRADVQSETRALDEDQRFMLTGDLNIIDVRWNMSYRINELEPYKYAFNYEDPEATIRAIARAEMNSQIGNRFIRDILVDERELILQEVKKNLTKDFERFNIGITIENIGFENIQPPAGEVAAAFTAVESAGQQRDTLINDANAEYERLIPEYEGTKERLIREAEGYYEKRINEAKGDVARYVALLAEYRKNPRITRDRLYYEMIEEVFTNLENADLIDKELSNFIPLKNLEGGR